MADFPTTNIRVNSQISPYTDDQVFPLFDSAHGLGGLRTVGTTAEMNAIFDRRRTRGMMVYVSGVSAYYALIGTTANSGWTTEFQIGAGTNILPLNNTFTGTNVFNAGVTFTTDIKVNNVNIGKGPGPSTNLIFGSGALSSNSSGQYNVAIGTSVLGVNTEGEQNIGIGYGTLLGNSSGNSNVAIGHGSATHNTTGSHNTAVGDTSLYENITGAYNTAIGTASLYNSKGDNNTALGSNSLMGIQTGSQNIAIGSDAGTSIPTGAAMTSATGGIYIGTLSKGSTQGRVNEIVIGTEAVGMGSNTAVLGATTQAAAFIYGLVHALGGVSAFGATLSGTVTAPTQTVGTNNTTVATTAFVQNEIIADAVTSFNGRTGAVQGVSAAAAGDGISVSGATGAVTITNTGVTRAAAGTGIFVSANTGTVTITNIGVQSFNGNTGAVTGASLGANTFTGLNIFSAGLSASSGLFGTLQSNSGATFNADVYVGATLSVNGNLVINGTTTTINSTTITVDDKNIELGSVTSPTDTTADGGGISLKGATDKTIVWSNVTSGTTLAAAWNFNQDINLTKSGNPAYYINGTIVIDGASLGPNIVNSNLTKVGTIATGVWQGTIIGGTYGGTGLSSYAKGDILYAAAAGSVLSKLAVSSTQGQLIQADGSGLFAWGDLLIADGSGNGVSTLTSGKYRIQDASTSVKGLSRYDSFNFSVAAGVVGITAIDGGSYT